MLPRTWVIVFVLVATAEIGLFAARNWDLVYLCQPASRLAESRRHFVSSAEHALARPRLTRRHLETIAAVGDRTGDRELALHALRRLAAEYPRDPGVARRLADALRRLERYEEAERIYRRLLAAPSGGAR